MFKNVVILYFITLVLLNNYIQNFNKIYAQYLNFENQLIQFVYRIQLNYLMASKIP